ncbi:uncharacterized protein LOC132262390 [Phlebotomus argentipes]|uniref:uncharacterized protein LOC132262390 n=1 Tax=Phlebotomus argentipes TaxID=94469 RepID=UPI0028932C07|nr:uncharacterized protein LOC132262390 [Phlebotomus argentipes]
MISKRLLLIVITFSVVISIVKAHYIPDDDHDHHHDHDSSEERDEASGVSGFFENIKCGIVHGAKKIKDGVTSGYNYVKGKLTPGSATEVPVVAVPANVTEIFPTPKTPMAPYPSEVPLTIPTSTVDERLVWEIDVRAFINETDERFPDTVIASTTPANISLDDRSLFDAPSFCPDGEKKDRNGRCRKIS